MKKFCMLFLSAGIFSAPEPSLVILKEKLVSAAIDLDQYRLKPEKDFYGFKFASEKWVTLAKRYYSAKKKVWGKGNRGFACLIRRAQKNIHCEKTYNDMKLAKVSNLSARQARAGCL